MLRIALFSMAVVAGVSTVSAGAATLTRK